MISKTILKIFSYIIYFINLLKIHFKKKKPIKKINKKSLLFCYDLDVESITYDFLEVLGLVELQRREKKIDFIDLLIIFNKKNKPRIAPEFTNYEKIVTMEEQFGRIHNLLIPISQLFPKVNNVFISEKNMSMNISQNYEFIIPKNNKFKPKPYYLDPKLLSINPENYYPMIKVPEYSLQIVKDIIKKSNIKKKIITISLRSYSYIPKRNSNVIEWIKFAKKIRKKYEIIFIPDMYDSQSKDIKLIEKNNFKVLQIVSSSIVLRAALYNISFINMAVACGPIYLSILQQKSKTMMFFNYKNYPKKYLEDALTAFDWKIGEQRKNYGKNHFFIWDEDRYEILVNNFNYFLNNIKK